MKTVLSRRQGETDKAFIVRQWAWCMNRNDHHCILQNDRREWRDRGAAYFHQLEAATWYQRSLMFKAQFDEFLPGTDVRESDLFGPFASIYAKIPERTGRVAFMGHVQMFGRAARNKPIADAVIANFIPPVYRRAKRNTLLETDAALKLAMSSEYGQFKSTRVVDPVTGLTFDVVDYPLTPIRPFKITNGPADVQTVFIDGTPWKPGRKPDVIHGADGATYIPVDELLAPQPSLEDQMMQLLGRKRGPQVIDEAHTMTPDERFALFNPSKEITELTKRLEQALKEPPTKPTNGKC